MKTPIRYAGGKSRAIKLIGPLGMNQETIISPFIGGGSLEVYWASNNIRVIGYDVFDVLVNFWQVLLNKKEQLVEELKKIEPTPERYADIKEVLMRTKNTQDMLSEWKTDYYKRDDIVELTDVQLAAYYFFNHNCSYGPGYLGWASKIYLNDKGWKASIDRINKFSVPSMKVYTMTFDNSIPLHNNDFLYLDPPYYTEKDADNKMFAGIYPMRNIPVHHNQFDHELLRDILKEHKGKFVLSYNNCETIRDYYSEFNQTFPQWAYSMGSGETRIGKNRQEMEMDNVKTSHEILITNF
jgi:DNA adenine methylase